MSFNLRCTFMDDSKRIFSSWEELFEFKDNIKLLDCYSNKLRTLPEWIGNLTNLKLLNCNNNQLIRLPESIGNLTNLKILYCNNIQLSTLPESIGNLTNLEGLYCTSNQLTRLPESIGNLTNLKELTCGCNQLSTLPESIGNLTNLEILYCANNQLSTLPVQLIQCNRLTYFNYSNNPIEYIPTPLLRRLERLRNSNNLYNDTQNVHDTSIQQSIKKSIFSLLNDKSDLIDIELNEWIVKNEYLTIKCKDALFEYIESCEIHSQLEITFKDLLKKVILRIESHKFQFELCNRLNEEMSDAECKCFTGRLSRLVNVLVGYYEDIEIKIADSTQIAVVIHLIKSKHGLRDEDELNDLAKEEIRKELQERGFSEEVIETWLHV